jgi:RNA polymerase sigma-70 factor (ECF subfamily)
MQTLTIDSAQYQPDRLIENEQAAEVQQALDRIDPLLRAILLLKEEESLSYREIATVVGIPEGTVGSRLNRARQALRQELVQLGW